MQRGTDADAIAQEVIRRTGGDIRLALPLGIGKPVTLADALVRAVRDRPDARLSIFTALTLERPVPSNDVERRFLSPAMDRLFGTQDGPLYARLMRTGELPDNIEVNEFFLMAGRWLGVAAAQQAYISANYVHARDVLLRRAPNVVMQLVAERDGRFSLSSNTDISADLFGFRADGTADFLAVFEVNPDMPFMDGPGATIAPGDVDLVLDPPGPVTPFSAPNRPVDAVDHAIGLHVSRLVVDGGTLQIGIGSMGDAVAHALSLRDRGAAEAIQRDCPFAIDPDPGGPFEAGLYAVTEMLVGGLLALFRDGVIRRKVDGAAIHAGFFVGSRDFRRQLRDLPPDRRAGIAMMPVSFTNALYGDEPAKRRARRDARFVNGAMKVSALGDVMSDSVADGQVVSGVGGQFDFVAQAFALDGARSVIALPATRDSGGVPESNIVWTVPAVSVPRHMRDVVATEYGIADLRDLPDAQVIAALVAIADSRFQNDLVARAKAAGKLPQGYRIPEACRRNLPRTVTQWLAPHRKALPDFPFGTDFDAVEQRLLPALRDLGTQAKSLRGKARLLWAAFALPPHPDETAAMSRMGYAEDRGPAAMALRGALRRVARSGW
ncbi:acetyl-CoA hydrolase/transferase C-terminal domain-containing protein [Palleronia rufa]|uniref:acetyl-CoA hydrolase/transferase C-terminal domain-containing protein n=1 Tax=Palleronia rufa TaxID=1530186 RepID=UPI00056A1D7E|nr:acetyl-CoA hydrolase/transferase C-terminal domain-containing protein [Palleronia rufa]